MQQNIAKDVAAKAACELVEPRMSIGLGTGSTAALFIIHLIERVHDGLDIKAVATSKRSWQQAKEGGIPLLDINQVTHLDLTIDGADEIDPNKRMIKGGGGALLREKIIASMSDEMVVIVDESKVVDALGKHPLPVEITPFGYASTIEKIRKLKLDGKLRGEGDPYITDNNHYIFDIQLNYPCNNLEDIDYQLRTIPGVVETGLFIGLAGRVYIGHHDGRLEIIR